MSINKSMNRPMLDNEVSSEHYTRDPHSGALLSVDHAGLQRYKRKIAADIRGKKQISEMSNDINSLKEELNEMKNLLSTFLNSYNKNDR